MLLIVVLLACSPVPLLSQLVTFSPEKLSMPAGDTAAFFCTISSATFSQFDYSLNWYKKINSTCIKKIAELNGNQLKIQEEKYTLINHTTNVEIRIQQLIENDTGEYYCGLIAFSSPSRVVESGISQLTVTERRATAIPNTTDQDHQAGDFKVPVVIVLSIAGAVLLGLIAYLLVMLTRRTGGQQKPQCENAPVKEEVTMYTVDYGVLEFQQDEHPVAAVESYPPDNTEYAVIMFPEEKPVTPERGKKTKNQRSPQI